MGWLTQRRFAFYWLRADSHKLYLAAGRGGGCLPKVTVPSAADGIEEFIVTLRGMKVILDSDLAVVYGVEVRRLNEQVKRNIKRFPEDFAFALDAEEWEVVRCLRSQNAILKRGQHRKFPPRAFTEHGALMAANVLSSAKAVEMSVFVVRAFVRMRTTLQDNRELAERLIQLEREITMRLDNHDAAIVEVLRRILDIVDPPPLPIPTKKRIGFGAKADD